MIPRKIIEELAPLYEEAMKSKDVIEAKRAKVIFDSECKKLYSKESETMRSSLTLQAFVHNSVVLEILAYLKQRKSKFPTIQPERQTNQS